jgi:cytochrome c oxidase assembly protein subunit 15
MLMAFVIIVIMMYLINEASQTANRFKYDPTLNKFVIVVVVLSLIQVFLGTQVREQIDVISKSLEYSQRELWISRTNVIFKVHRSFAILLVLSNVVLWIRSRQVQFSKSLTNAIIIVLMIEVMSGIVLSHFDMMRLMQPIHLVAASLLFVLQMGLYFQLRSAKTI